MGMTSSGPGDSGDGIRRISTFVSNFSVQDQQIGAAASALLAGSTLAVPAGKLQIGTVLRWQITLSKTNAGTAANNFFVRLGTGGVVGDASVLQFTLPVGTAVPDVGDIEIWVTVRGPLTSSCKIQGYLVMRHGLQITGLATIPCVCLNVLSGNVDVTVANLIASVSCTTAASTVLTFQQVIAEAINV